MNFHPILFLLGISSVFSSSTQVDSHSGNVSNFGDVVYSEMIISCASHVALSDFNITASMINESSPLTDLALSDAFDIVKISMNIDIEKLKVPVVNQILLTYTKMCISHLIQPDCPNEQMLRKLSAHKIKILVYECLIFDFKIADKQALKLLEFIYRFADDGHRYHKAFLKLYSCLSNESIATILDKFVQYFDPNRQNLLIISPKLKSLDNPLLPAFNSFIRNIYSKIITLIDPIEDNEVYFQYAAMLITSIISYNMNYEEFYDILVNSMVHIDPIRLLSSSDFFKAASLAISEAVKNESLLLEYFLKFFLNDETISRIQNEEDEIRFGGFIKILKTDEKYFKLLSIESKLKLEKFERKFMDYDVIISHIEKFRFIKINFLQLSSIHLEILSKEVQELEKNYDLIIKIDPSTVSNALADGANHIHELVAMSRNDNNFPVFNYYRFKVFLSILTFLMKNEIYLLHAKTPTIKIIQFFNEKVIEVHHDEEIFSMITSHLFSFVIGNKLNPTVSDIKDIYTFFMKLLGEDRGIQEFCSFLTLNLHHTNSISETYNLIEKCCNELGISFISIIIPFLLNAIQIYLETSSFKESLFLYRNGRLLSLITLVNDSKTILSRSEYSILTAFKARYITSFKK